ncbi:MAG TPA: hypothetical protein VGZ93_02840 [Candidatus Methylacidiphilales bacterium]|jgi:uncharacterized membrane protein|nr:hypothetical protein [Candidatus Methylacidiphilales bacterium]
MKFVGILLIALGVLALVYHTFTYTQTKQVAEIGSLEIKDHESHDVTVPPYAGVICIVAGTAVLIFGGRGK